MNKWEEYESNIGTEIVINGLEKLCKDKAEKVQMDMNKKNMYAM